MPGDSLLSQALGRQPQKLHKLTTSCRTAFHGSDYGGWTLCPDGLSTESIVYACGVGEDASFDLAIIKAYGAQVYAFDPTPRSIEWVGTRDWPSDFHFFPVGIAARDGRVTLYPPDDPDHISHSIVERLSTAERAIQVETMRLQTISRRLGHQRIDVLKMDIEGAEYEVIEDIANTPGIEIGQILVEFHHFLPGITTEQTCAAVDLLMGCGYQTFYISPSGQEYSFIRR